MVVRMQGTIGGAWSMRHLLQGLAWIAVVAMLATMPRIASSDETTTPDSSREAVAAVDSPAMQPAMGTAMAPATRAESLPLENFRAHDLRGLNVFEAPKSETNPFEGKSLVWGFAFTQQFQGVKHQNTADAKMVTVNSQQVNANQLVNIGYGFNNATANLYLDAQMARGIRVSLTGYMSSRHHQEMWVKDGYLQIDASPIENDLLDGIMTVTTLRVGHFEINYGDAHFRRSDNGNAFFNPFVGNLLMDAFTTEIGAEAYVRKAGFMAMVGTTGGEIRGQVQRPDDRSLSFLSKVGMDRQVTNDLRVRLTGSFYTNQKAVNSTLYTGSRAGSRYYSVLENTQSTEAAQAWSGDVQPGFRNRVQAWVINPFIKYRGLELFGNIEQAQGGAATEPTNRTWDQYAGEGLYRFAGEKVYVASRYNVAKGHLSGIANEVTVDRVQTGGGWFVTPNILAKAEYIRQNYRDFPTTDIRNGGRFDGFMIEGVVAF